MGCFWFVRPLLRVLGADQHVQRALGRGKASPAVQQPRAHPYHTTYNAAVSRAESGTVIRTRDTDTGAYFDTSYDSDSGAVTVSPHDADSARTATEFFTEPDKRTYVIYSTSSRTPGARSVPEGSDTYA